MGFPAWQAPADECAGGPTDGAKAFLAEVLALYEDDEFYSLGIYNCRDVRGSTSPSVHGDGRAIDVGVPGRQNPDGTKFVKDLLPHVGKLGIQCIIWNRTIWSAKSPSGRPYTGVHPHYDHVHVELTREAAAKLTRTTVRAALKGSGKPKTVKAPKFPLPKGHYYGTPRRSPHCHSGYYWASDRPGIRQWQQRMRDRGWRISVDGLFGPQSERVLVAFQKEKGLAVDGLLGPKSWAAAWTAPVT